MLHRIRLAFETPAYKAVTGTIEVDETYVGGKGTNMHAVEAQSRFSRGTAGTPDKTARSGCQRA